MDELEKLVAKRKQLEDKRVLEAYHESDKLKEEALAKNILPRKVADRILKDYFGIKDERNDYQTALAMVDKFLSKNSEGTFMLLDFESFCSIGNHTLRSAVGRGIAKHLKEREEVEYLRDDEGNICRTKNHAAIYVLKKKTGNKDADF